MNSVPSAPQPPIPTTVTPTPASIATSVTPTSQGTPPAKVVYVEEKKPFYTEWTFWILMVLVLITLFGGLVWVYPIVSSPLNAEIVKRGELVQLHVKRLVVPESGYLVLQRDIGGVPSDLVEVSPRLTPDTYTDFYITLTYDEGVLPDAYFEELKAARIFVTYYKDAGNNNIYNFLEDTEPTKDFFGRKTQILLVNGK